MTAPDRGRPAEGFIPLRSLLGGCEFCGTTTGGTTYGPTLLEWPTGLVLRLCLHCASPLCEHCGLRPATLSCGRRRNWHLCEPCTKLPPYHRLRRRVPLGGR